MSLAFAECVLAEVDFQDFVPWGGNNTMVSLSGQAEQVVCVIVSSPPLPISLARSGSYIIPCLPALSTCSFPLYCELFACASKLGSVNCGHIEDSDRRLRLLRFRPKQEQYILSRVGPKDRIRHSINMPNIR